MVKYGMRKSTDCSYFTVRGVRGCCRNEPMSRSLIDKLKLTWLPLKAVLFALTLWKRWLWQQKLCLQQYLNTNEWIRHYFSKINCCFFSFCLIRIIHIDTFLRTLIMKTEKKPGDLIAQSGQQAIFLSYVCKTKKVFINVTILHVKSNILFIWILSVSKKTMCIMIFFALL